MGSIKEKLDATYTVNLIRMSLNSPIGHDKIWVLVEGEDDCKIYPKFFDAEAANFEFVHGGKGQLIKALNTLLGETKQVIAIRDADFLHLEGNFPAVTNLFLTDYHDIEMTMLCFDDVRYNLFTEYQLQDRSVKIWQNILNEASYIGYVRWYNEKKQCKIIFKGIGYGRFVTITDYKISIRNKEFLDELSKRSANKTEELNLGNIDQFREKEQTSDFLNLCNGHDVIDLFALSIGGKVSAKDLGSHLRLSFLITHFAKTKLYSLIHHWQNKSGYHILLNADTD